jgi:hypothetical protein
VYNSSCSTYDEITAIDESVILEEYAIDLALYENANKVLPGDSITTIQHTNAHTHKYTHHILTHITLTNTHTQMHVTYTQIHTSHTHIHISHTHKYTYHIQIHMT